MGQEEAGKIAGVVCISTGGKAIAAAPENRFILSPRRASCAGQSLQVPINLSVSWKNPL